VTSIAWALLHVQYDWLTVAQIFLIGCCSLAALAEPIDTAHHSLHVLANLVANHRGGDQGSRG